MANREKGEISFEHEGRTYTLVLNTNALVKLQQLFGTADTVPDLAEIDGMVRRGSLLHIRAVFWAGLQKYHAKEIPTPDAAGDLIDDAAQAATTALLASIGLSAPDQKDVSELAAANPPQAQATRGRKRGGTSTSTHAPVA